MREAVLVSLAITCCSIPDGDDWSRLKAGISALPAETLGALRTFTANAAAKRYMQGREKQKVGTLTCADATGDYEESVDVSVLAVLKCLSVNIDLDYVQCFWEVKSSFEDAWRKVHPGGACFMVPDARWRPDVLPDDFDPDNVDLDSVAEFIAASPMPLPGFAPGGGLRGLFPVLCPLATHPDEIGCPDDPLTPGETPAPSGSSGGDR